MITPCVPVRPRATQASWKPSIFSVTAPTAMIAPRWSIAPVIARSWRSGTSVRALIRQQASAPEAESPSTPP